MQERSGTAVLNEWHPVRTVASPASSLLVPFALTYNMVFWNALLMLPSYLPTAEESLTHGESMGMRFLKSSIPSDFATTCWVYTSAQIIGARKVVLITLSVGEGA